MMAYERNFSKQVMVTLPIDVYETLHKHAEDCGLAPATVCRLCLIKMVKDLSVDEVLKK